jgi:hypothetical protein
VPAVGEESVGGDDGNEISNYGMAAAKQMVSPKG